MSISTEIRIYSTCPQSKGMDAREYAQRVGDVAAWSEAAGCHGILVYTDNALVDPWLLARLVVARTERLRPLVAVQPVYMHPYTAAKMVATLAYLDGRAVDLNMLAGGFRNDLLALGDETPHDERYDRTVEYAQIMRGLLEGQAPVSLEGRYYRVKNLRMSPPVPPELVPEFLISGSSTAGLAAAAAIGATAVKYPQPPGEEAEAGGTADKVGVRVGVIARASADEAWAIARERFPEDRKGQIAHSLATKVSDSEWHRQLSAREAAGRADDNPYWLGPLQNYQTFCPYLVGSYDRVAEEVAGYLALGVRTVILDIPPSEEELRHTSVVFEGAASRLQR